MIKNSNHSQSDQSLKNSNHSYLTPYHPSQPQTGIPYQDPHNLPDGFSKYPEMYSMAKEQYSQLRSLWPDKGSIALWTTNYDDSGFVVNQLLGDLMGVCLGYMAKFDLFYCQEDHKFIPFILEESLKTYDNKLETFHAEPFGQRDFMLKTLRMEHNRPGQFSGTCRFTLREGDFQDCFGKFLNFIKGLG